MSSTPLQSPGDSGYFGSGHRRNNAVILNSCSPIKESIQNTLPENIHFMHDLSPQVKFEQNLNFESLSNIEVNDLSELEFTNPTFSGQFNFDKVSLSSEEGQGLQDNQFQSYSSGCIQSTSCSLSADHDINYKLFDYASSDKPSHQKNESKGVAVFGRRKVDFIHELFERNCYSLTSYILSFLSAKELCIASCVSKKWNRIILNDSKANARRQDLVTERLTFLNGPSKVKKLESSF